MDLIIRKATAADMPQVLELIIELAVFEKEPNAVKVSVEELIEEGFGQDPQFTCFVAEVSGEVVGMALIYFRFSTWTGRTVHLEDLIVKESLRGKGIGDLLYAEVMKYSKKHGVRRVEWVVLNWNERAIKFYERSGAVMHKDWYLVEMPEEGVNAIVEKSKE
ncbi:MAG: GNAT family N-acetyltransferase [Flavobacteriaceae bacterium]|nr:GNAT family N-acetyltransferase [Flavobacteriaceae bacterium]